MAARAYYLQAAAAATVAQAAAARAGTAEGDVAAPRKVAPRKDRAAAELSMNWAMTAKRGRLPLAPADAGSAGSSSSVTTMLDLESSFCREEEEAAMILLQLSGQEERGPADDEPEEEMPAAQQMLVPVEHQMPAAVAEHESIPRVDQLEPVPAEHVADAQDVAMLDAPEVEHVSGPGALLPMMPAAGHVSGGAAVQQADKSAGPPVEHTFGIITESSLAAAIEQAKKVAEVRDKKGKLVLSDAKNPLKKRRLQDIIQFQAAAPQDPQSSSSRAAEAFFLGASPPATRPRIPSPASTRRFVCPRCDKKFPTYQALGGHMASHNRANKYGADGQQHQQLVAQLAVQSLTPSASTDSGRRRGTNTNLPPPPKEPILLAPRAAHPCSRCELIFRTGQALGGHMRRHWIADKVRADAAQARAAMDAEAAAASVPAAAPRGEPLDFDLNEMPGEE